MLLNPPMPRPGVKRAVSAVSEYIDTDVTNAGTGASIPWSPIVYESDFAVKEVSPANISGYSNPYSIEVTAERVFWWPGAPPEIAGLNIIQLPMQGIVARPTDSSDPFTVRIVNSISEYVWSS